MPAYVRLSVAEFVLADPTALVGQLELAYARDAYTSQFVQQTRAWEHLLPLLQCELQTLQGQLPVAAGWTVLLEFPLYRLRKRLDIVLLSTATVIVVEAKFGDCRFRGQQQVEEYALDLRDFHAESHGRPIVPILWCTEATAATVDQPVRLNGVAAVHFAGKNGLASLLAGLPLEPTESAIDGKGWDESPYRPVPNIIEAATSIFEGHGVRAIAQADASNLRQAASRAIELITHAKENRHCALVFLTGVPGSGKTLAGLHAVHDAIATGAEQRGDIVYLSGNTPLVTVLREALARDEYRRGKETGSVRQLNVIRREMRARIQHINDFLKQGLSGTGPPHEHAIVFDEAQRAWDVRQGKKKFDRDASEPSLLLELMGRHADWSACVCLVGEGQEINAGEQGVAGWGEALRRLSHREVARWRVYGPPDVLNGRPSTGGLGLGDVSGGIASNADPTLQLVVPFRSFRSPETSNWVEHVLDGNREAAAAKSASLGHYPIMLTRSLAGTRRWLRDQARGYRRCGLVASSRARRLRADGLGVELIATDGADIAHWYLNPRDDIRSSYALEVTTNQYTSQGLELDFVGICWGGDFLRDEAAGQWVFRTLSGNKWHAVTASKNRDFIKNSYRVLLTRAREGLVIWVPEGDMNDATRDPRQLDATAEFLIQCGARPLEAHEVASDAYTSENTRS
jgi:DUF2075 family protein